MSPLAKDPEFGSYHRLFRVVHVPPRYEHKHTCVSNLMYKKVT